jgi:mannose-6-phosphate isomerase-like protein (cupin superfamily)
MGDLSMDDVTIIDRQPNVAIDKAVLFSMRNLPLLEQGTTYDPLATAENLWVNIKVYASGGENALHAHGGEDHAFIVLQGAATFTFGDGRTAVVGKYEGVMIPKNVLYKFEANRSENLVLLRVGGGARKVTGLSDLTRFGTPQDILQQTTFADGSIKEGASARNGETSKPRIYAKGKYFAPD